MNTRLLISGLALGLSLVFSTARAQIGTPVTLTYGTLGSALTPFQFQQPNNVNEILYLASEINRSGTILGISFQKDDGSTASILDSVWIGIRHSNATTLPNAVMDTTGYQWVYQGDFPNTAATGFMYVAFSQPFVYDGTSNIQILCYRRNGTPRTPVANSNRYFYGLITTGNRTRRATGASVGIPTPGTTPLTSTDVQPNISFDFQSPTGLAKGAEAQFRLFPNPSQGEVEIRLNTGQNSGSAQVLNAKGQVLHQQELNSATERLRLPQLPTGLYWVRVRTSAGVQTQTLSLY